MTAAPASDPGTGPASRAATRERQWLKVSHVIWQHAQEQPAGAGADGQDRLIGAGRGPPAVTVTRTEPKPLSSNVAQARPLSLFRQDGVRPPAATGANRR